MAKSQKYTVQAGDNPAKLAKMLYGDERLFNVILKEAGGMLTPGQVLKLPDLRQYQADLKKRGELHYVSPGEFNYAQSLTGGDTQPKTTLAPNLQNPPTNYQTAPGSTPPPGYGPSAYTPPTPKPFVPQTGAPPPLPTGMPANYAQLAAQNVPAPKPIGSSGQYTGLNLPTWAQPKPQIITAPPSNLTGILPLQQPNPAQPGAATMYYTGRDLPAWTPTVRAGVSRGVSQAGRNLPGEEIKQMDKPPVPPTFIYNPWGEGPPPPPGYTPPAPPPINNPYSGQPTYPGGGRGGGRPRPPSGGGGRGAVSRYRPNSFAQASTMPFTQGGRNPMRDLFNPSRTGLVAFRLP